MPQQPPPPVSRPGATAAAEEAEVYTIFVKAVQVMLRPDSPPLSPHRARHAGRVGRVSWPPPPQGGATVAVPVGRGETVADIKRKVERLQVRPPARPRSSVRLNEGEPLSADARRGAARCEARG